MINKKSSVRITEPIRFALEELEESVRRSAPDLSFTIRLDREASLSAQGYRLSREGDTVGVSGGADAGLMYGILDIAQAIGREGGVSGLSDVRVEPYLEYRGIKFNIPLDARTPSYSDASDSAQHSIEDMWDFSFWTRFLDDMARNKYNVLSLWTLSPFPSLVRIPEYPLAALDDVKKTTRPLRAELSGWGMYGEDLENSLVTVKKLTIDEKIAFWRSVMEYAESRCVGVLIFTWNLFVYGTEKTPYGITARQDNEVTKDFVYCGTKALLRTYPLLAGIGVTAGEHMFGDESDVPFLAETYGRGVREVLAEQPGRPFRFIHRMQMARYGDIMKAFGDFPCPFEISFKYSQAHMYSSTRPAFIDEFLKIKKPGQKIWLTVRNDDFYMYRWGNPKFAGDYLRNMPADTIAGCYMGADGFTWGRDYLDARDESHGLFLDKMWYMISIWGRLSYRIDLPEEYFRKELAAHFRLGEKGNTLYESWKNASFILSEFNCVHWHDFDFQWYPEGCCMYEPRTDKLVFADINEFVSCPGMPGTEYCSVREYCEARLKGENLMKIDPLTAADSIWKHAEEAMEGIKALKASGEKDPELARTLGDIRALSVLGCYYSLKIRAAVSLCLYRTTGEKTFQNEAVSLLETANGYWRTYSGASRAMYKPQVLTRLCGLVDVRRFDESADLDVLLAKEDEASPDGSRRRRG